jgi:hypothetical protein
LSIVYVVGTVLLIPRGDRNNVYNHRSNTTGSKVGTTSILTPGQQKVAPSSGTNAKSSSYQSDAVSRTEKPTVSTTTSIIVERMVEERIQTRIAELEQRMEQKMRNYMAEVEAKIESRIATPE